MGHGIYNETRDFQIAEEMAWHKLTKIGTPKREAFPEIVGMPLYYDGGKEAKYSEKSYFLPIASDDMLPVAPPYCAGTYTLFQPRQAWDWIHEVLSGTGFKVSSMGMLWNRSLWFLSTELTELKSLSIGDGRDCKFQLGFSGGLDKMVSPQSELSAITQVCANTVSLSRMTGEVLFKEKATKNFANKLDSAKEEIEKAIGMTQVFKLAMDKLATKACKPERAEKIFVGYLTNPEEKSMTKTTRNKVNQLVDLHKVGRGNKGETEFDMLNAYTEYLTRGSDTETSRIPAGKRFASGEFGGNADSKADFVNLLTTRRGELQETERRGAKLLTVGSN